MGEVEAQAVRHYQGTSLVNMVAQYLFQSSMEQMRSRVVTSHGHAAFRVYFERYSVAYM